MTKNLGEVSYFSETISFALLLFSYVGQPQVSRTLTFTLCLVLWSLKGICKVYNNPYPDGRVKTPEASGNRPETIERETETPKKRKQVGKKTNRIEKEKKNTENKRK